MAFTGLQQKLRVMRRRYIGAKAIVKIWTEWAYNDYTMGDADGVVNQNSCDGTFYVLYRLQSRYFQFPDGTGREATEYRAGIEVDRAQYDGYCGYTEPLLEYPYYGYSQFSYYGAWISTQTGTLWRSQYSQIGYTSADGTTLMPSGVYCHHKGSNYDVYSPSMNPDGSKYWEM